MKPIISFCLVALCSGCVMTYEEGRVGSPGYSVYQTTYQQIADKEHAANPGTEVSPAGMDGALTERVIDSYRGVKGDAKQVGQPIQINIGND
ncbi:hypothetical protein Pres01_51020 [Metapseudomonas resinovorans]|uniref:hypothetical protein n=1 Tax=Metapseudomonas resinovorans TaxID=53412 RepID=UPI0009848C14|nr:hypothetical protein [Pseudomonas resinovorans]GLZ89051.1 hypothetical protein Pres01_51020 [Pseudomonas resinovorans]